MALPSRYLERVGNRRFSKVVAVAVVLTASTGGCTSSVNGEPPCLPPAYSLSPTTAKPGETVTVTAPDSDCNPRYGANALIQVVVTDETGVQVINTTTPMTDAGGFSYTFDVPAHTAVGEAVVTAMPRNNLARGGVVALERASCAVPVETLSIRR
jgi:hypothetical protein